MALEVSHLRNQVGDSINSHTSFASRWGFRESSSMALQFFFFLFFPLNEPQHLFTDTHPERSLCRLCLPLQRALQHRWVLRTCHQEHLSVCTLDPPLVPGPLSPFLVVSTKARVCMCARSVVSSSFVTPWTIARQAPVSMGCPRQEYRSGLPFPSPRDLPDPGFKPASPVALILAGRLFITEPQNSNNIFQNTVEN